MQVYPYDFVCGTILSEYGVDHMVKREGCLYKFCCSGCRDTFLQNPDLFIHYRKREGRRIGAGH